MSILSIILIILSSIIFGASLHYLYTYFTRKPAVKLDEETAAQNEQIKIENQVLKNETENLEKEITRKTQEISLIEENLDTIYVNSMDVMQEKFAQSAEKESQKYRQFEEELQEKYKELAQDCAISFKLEFDEKEKELQEIKEAFALLKERITAANKAALEEEKRQQEKDFSRIVISEESLEEIEKIKSIEKYLKDSRPLNKVIWEQYYKNPTAAMISRVLEGKNNICGIYKITNLINHRCYIGQSVNIAERWRQHIKRGLGVDAITNNKLYPALKEFGVENFSFEVIEECERSVLNREEKFWIECFDSYNCGYNSTSGNK